MKDAEKHRLNTIELPAWLFLTILVAASACVCSLIPLIAQYRSDKCDVPPLAEPPKFNLIDEHVDIDPSVHVRRVRQAAADQCSVIPPTCPATTTVITTTTTTARSTVSTVSVTRPVITTMTTQPPTTTPDPWATSPRPYNSWRLPRFAKPKAYTLTLSCPVCFDLFNAPSTIPFDGTARIQMNVTEATQFLVLHAKNLNINQALVIIGGSQTAAITYIREFDMIYLNFTSTIGPGEITLEIIYTGEINQQDQTGFYRETFSKSYEDSIYVVGGNFQPIHARQAFPCFDEPDMEAAFTLSLAHPTNTSVALSNTAVQSVSDGTTTFETTPTIATQVFAWAILPKDGFKQVTRMINSTSVSIWIRSNIAEENDTNLEWAFDIVTKSLEFAEDYFNVSSTVFPPKLDLIGVPDLVLDEKASSSWGLLLFREEFLSVDPTLNSAERIQTTAKVIGEHILQVWLSKVTWWDQIWFGKSLASYLTYRMIEDQYPDFNMMEQFVVREIVPIMIDDGKSKVWPVSNRNLMNNAEVIDSLAPLVFNKGAALLRLLEHAVGTERFQAAVIAAVQNPEDDGNLESFYASLNTQNIPNTVVTPEAFLRAWLEEQNYPEVTIEFTPGNETMNATAIFRQTRHLASREFDTTGLNSTYVWPIFMECQLGGTYDGDFLNVSGNIEESMDPFVFNAETLTMEFPGGDYQWIKCNKDFYSYIVTDYIFAGDDVHRLWEYFDLLFPDDVFSSNDRANLINDAFLLSRTGADVSYDQAIELVRRMFDPVRFDIPWTVFIWHWNHLMEVEEHSRYFENFKKFATIAILAPNNYDVSQLLAVGSTHRERLIKSMMYELLCRVQNTDALNKATELFLQIPADYFSGTNGETNVPADYLATVLYYHLQNINDIDEWDKLQNQIIENKKLTAQKRQAFLRALGAAKEIWRLKSYLEFATSIDRSLIDIQDLFDIMSTVSQNPIGRDVVWNFYRHNYEDLVKRFGTTNRLFNQLITVFTQSFENEFYYMQMMKFIQTYPNPSKYQQLAFDQVLLNFEWLIDGLAQSLDNAISGADKKATKFFPHL